MFPKSRTPINSENHRKNHKNMVKSWKPRLFSPKITKSIEIFEKSHNILEKSIDFVNDRNIRYLL